MLRARLRTAALTLVAASLLSLLTTPLGIATGLAQSAKAVIEELDGRWSGWGSVKMSNGSSEQVKCVATFFVQGTGTSVRQNLRCASSGYKIDVRADITISGSAVSGTWEERNHSNTGELSGRISGSTFKLAITGQALNAAMTMSSSPCKLNINIAPRQYNVDRIAIGLRKC